MEKKLDDVCQVLSVVTYQFEQQGLFGVGGSCHIAVEDGFFSFDRYLDRGSFRRSLTRVRIVREFSTRQT